MIIEKNISLKSYNSFGIDVNASLMYKVSSEEELLEALTIINPISPQDLLVLGGGSNILLLDDVSLPIIKNEIKGINILEENEDFALVRSGAGELWHNLVLFTLDNNLSGLENLSLIPGSVGASPMQNIGAYGAEVKDTFHSLTAISVIGKSRKLFYNEDCEFGYRESIFKKKLKGEYIITEVIFKLAKKATLKTDYGAIKEALANANKLTIPTTRDVSNAVIAIRKSKLPDPKMIGNAGSFFKNPEIDLSQFEQLKLQFPAVVAYPIGKTKMKLAAGWLIENCGWKGYRENDAGVHVKQALVLVNYDKASGEDIFLLSEKIIKSVQEKFNVLLEKEVNII